MVCYPYTFLLIYCAVSLVLFFVYKILIIGLLYMMLL